MIKIRNLYTQGSLSFEVGKRNLFNGISIIGLDWRIGKNKKTESTASADFKTSSMLAPFLAGVGISFAGFLIAVATNKKEVRQNV